MFLYEVYMIMWREAGCFLIENILKKYFIDFFIFYIKTLK